MVMLKLCGYGLCIVGGKLLIRDYYKGNVSGWTTLIVGIVIVLAAMAFSDGEGV